MSEKRRYSCPKCGRDDRLWEAVLVPGWRDIDCFLDPTPTWDRGIEWLFAEYDPDADEQVGCGQCDWRGMRDELVVIGIDGKPLFIPREDQTSLEGS